MTEHKHADDGGPVFTPIPIPQSERDRFEAAKTFAAAWLPILITDASDRLSYVFIQDVFNLPECCSLANKLGLAMADDLLRRLKGE